MIIRKHTQKTQRLGKKCIRHLSINRLQYVQDGVTGVSKLTCDSVFILFLSPFLIYIRIYLCIYEIYAYIHIDIFAYITYIMSLYTARVSILHMYVYVCGYVTYTLYLCIYMPVVVSDVDAENANSPLPPPCCMSLRNLWP